MPVLRNERLSFLYLTRLLSAAGVFITGLHGNGILQLASNLSLYRWIISHGLPVIATPFVNFTVPAFMFYENRKCRDYELLNSEQHLMFLLLRYCAVHILMLGRNTKSSIVWDSETNNKGWSPFLFRTVKCSWSAWSWRSIPGWGQKRHNREGNVLP